VGWRLTKTNASPDPGEIDSPHSPFYTLRRIGVIPPMMDVKRMPDLVGKTFGPYRILEQIGSGGMATVYKAYRPGTDRLVAIKVLNETLAQDETLVERFKREARLIIKLKHPAIVPVHDAGEQNGYAYLAMSYLRAGTVADLLAHGPLTPPDAARILNNVAAALDYAHAHHVIHRDVKPGNVLVDEDGHAYLTDFGVAKVREASVNISRSGEALGTPAYMAPEQALGQPVTPQTDVYALGVMLFEMLTGRQPYLADTPMAVALMHVYNALPSPRLINPNLPEAVEAVVMKALAKDPASRYTSAGEMAHAFTQAIGPVVERTTVKLPDLSKLIATQKSTAILTDDVKREIRRMENQDRWQRARRWLPWAVTGLLGLAALVGLAFSSVEISQGRLAAAQTATAMMSLLNQLNQTTAAGDGSALQPTISFLQTQMSPGAGTLNPVQNTATAQPSLVFTSTSTRTPTPTRRTAQPTVLTLTLPPITSATPAPVTSIPTLSSPATLNPSATSAPILTNTPTHTPQPTATLTIAPPTATPSWTPSATPFLSLPTLPIPTLTPLLPLFP